MTLKELRESCGKTRAEVAATLGISIRTVSHYECGTRSLDISLIIPLATIFDCSEREVIEAQLKSIVIRKT